MKDKNKSIYKSTCKMSIKQDLIDQTIKIVEKKYGIKKSGWARWITKAGYIFEISNIFNADENALIYNIFVKPIYVDDLLWEIIGYEKEIRPFSLRINGGLAVSGILMFNHKWHIDGDSGYTQENLISMFDSIYSEILSLICEFIDKYPDPNTYYNEDINDSNRLITILMLCHNNRFKEVVDIIGKEVAEHKLSGLIFEMPDGNWKDAYTFIIDYCKNREPSL